MTAPIATTPPPPAADALVRPAAPIEVISASRWYGNVVAVNEVSFAVGPGITGLLGPNGAGKSTLLHMLSGFLKPSRGEVRLFGEPMWQNPAMYARVGLVPERESVYPFLTGRKFVELSAQLHGLADVRAATEKAIAAVEMEPHQERATGGYSKGMKQRIKVAAAMVHDPEVLLLDEPFNGMDPHQRLQMMALLRGMADAGRVILFSSHILEEVEQLSDSILVVVGGRLAASGDFKAIRKLMTDRPHTFRLRTNDNRRLAAALVAEPAVISVEMVDGSLTVRTADFGAFTAAVGPAAQANAVRIHELLPADESLESVFSYLVRR